MIDIENYPSLFGSGEAAEGSDTLNDAGRLVVYEDWQPALPLLLELAEEQLGEEGSVGSSQESRGDPAGEEQPGGAGVSSEGGQLLYVVTAGSDQQDLPEENLNILYFFLIRPAATM